VVCEYCKGGLGVGAHELSLGWILEFLLEVEWCVSTVRVDWGLGHDRGRS